MADPAPFGEALQSIEAKLDQVLWLHRQIEQNVSELLTGQSTTHGALVDLRKGLVKVPHSSSTLEPLPEVANGDNMTNLQSKDTDSAPIQMPTATMLRARASTVQVINMVDGIASDASLDQEQTDDKLDMLLGMGQQSIRIDGQPSLMSEMKSRTYMLDPHSKVRVAHDLLSILVLAADVMSAPVVLAWDLQVEGALLYLGYISVAFWSCDIVMSFVTGFYVDGELECRPSLVAVRYLRSWLMPDIVVVLADLLLLCSGGDAAESSRGSTSGILRLSKVSRFLRVARLCRLARASEVIARLTEASVYLEVTVETMRPLLIIFFVNHVLACMFWSISKYLPSDTGLQWINGQMSSNQDITYADASVLYQYLTCMHWSLTQQTPGSMQVSPLNSCERFFNCLCLLFGMLLFSSLISSISAKTMQHYLKQKDKLIKLAALRRFLANKVQPGIVIAAQFQANKALSNTSGKPVTLNEITAIALLPQALQRKIQVELCAKHLRHPLFRCWFIMDAQGAHTLCHDAIDFVGLAAEDHLFFPRTTAAGAYVTTAGSAIYMLEAEGYAEEVNQDRFFCEAALWSKWKHVGELTATTGCELLLIGSEGLFKCLDEDIAVKYVVVQYGRIFHSRLVASPLLAAEQGVNDLSVAFTEFDAMVPSLPLKCKQLIGAAAVCVAKQRRSWKARQVREVRAGRCCLMVNWDGEVERIKSIILLRLSRQDGRILVQLGDWSEGAVQVHCKLPGTTQEEGETPTQAFARLFQGALTPFAGSFDCTGQEAGVIWQESKRMQVITKYLKTVNHAELTREVATLALEATELSRPVHMNVRHSMMSMGSVFSTGTTTWASTGSHATARSSDIDFDSSMFALANATGEITIVSWLRPQDFAFLTSPAGETSLQGLMESVTVEPQVAEAARTRFASCQEADRCVEGPADANTSV